MWLKVALITTFVLLANCAKLDTRAIPKNNVDRSDVVSFSTVSSFKNGTLFINI